TARDITANLLASQNDGQFGVQYEACAEGGQDVGWVDNGDWIEWKINVPTAGTYKLTSRSASTAAGSISVSVDGVKQTGDDIAVGSTGGYQTWQTFTGAGSFSLGGGTRTLRVTFNSASQNLEYVKLVTAASCTPACSGKVCGSDGCGGQCGPGCGV